MKKLLSIITLLFFLLPQVIQANSCRAVCGVCFGYDGLKSNANRLKIARWKRKGVVNFDGSDLKTNFRAALIQPDGKPETPAFLVFENYEKILKWNRSLRFGISVCTLANMIKI